jgi:hypothetical protein
MASIRRYCRTYWGRDDSGEVAFGWFVRNIYLARRAASQPIIFNNRGILVFRKLRLHGQQQDQKGVADLWATIYRRSLTGRYFLSRTSA